MYRVRKMVYSLIRWNMQLSALPLMDRACILNPLAGCHSELSCSWCIRALLSVKPLANVLSFLMDECIFIPQYLYSKQYLL